MQLFLCLGNRADRKPRQPGSKCLNFFWQVINFQKLVWLWLDGGLKDSGRPHLLPSLRICSSLMVIFGSFWESGVGWCRRDLQMGLDSLTVLSLRLGDDLHSVPLTMMTATWMPQEGRRGHLSPSSLINQCPGTNKRINRKGFLLKMSGWEPSDAAFPRVPLKTLMD